MPLTLLGERLGGAELTGAAASTAVVSFGNYKYLTIMACVSGYASGGIFSLRFSAGSSAIDTGTNYRDQNHPDATTAVAAWGTMVLGNSQTMLRLADATITTGRQTVVNIMNRANTMHTCSWTTVNEGNSTAAQKLIVGSGNWQTATALQINNVQMVSSGGNLNAGTGFVVYGYNSL